MDEFEKILNLYKNDQSFVNNIKLVNYLIGKYDYDKALSYANEKPEAYIDDEYQNIYIDLLLKCNKFILCWQFVKAINEEDKYKDHIQKKQNEISIKNKNKLMEEYFYLFNNNIIYPTSSAFSSRQRASETTLNMPSK